MYKNQIYFIVLSVLISCTSPVEHSVKTVFYTQDSLYKITFDKPLELDTFYSWKDSDDNVCSDEHKYRFSKKSFPVQKETGFFWTSHADSTYRITLKHVESYACKSDLSADSLVVSPDAYKRNLLIRAKNDNIPTQVLFSKKTDIHNHIYVLCAYRSTEPYKNGYDTYYLKAYIPVDSNVMVITADCRTYNCDGFINRMEKSFQTIEIERMQ